MKSVLKNWWTRRQMVKASTAVGVGAIVTTRLSRIRRTWAGTGKSDELRVGLIGCGSRGLGAVENAVSSSNNVRLVAIGDVFPDRLEASRTILSQSEHADRLAVDGSHAFAGWDAFEKVLKTDIDYVILATPPGFRPLHLEAAIAAGKHVFAEKPIAVDGPGMRRVFAAAEQANRKKLGVGVGLQRRHHLGYLELIKRIHQGAIGKVLAARCFWNSGPLWMKPREKHWSDMEWQLRNWIYFTWLSGDHILEQHIHNLDVVNWVMGAPPVAAVGMGGRQQRVAPAYGHIYDHFSVDFEYPGNIHALSMCRQMAGCVNTVSEHFQGTTGQANANNRKFDIDGKRKWEYDAEGEGVSSSVSSGPYVREHTDLIASIRKGKPQNELGQACQSNVTALMGRLAVYTGQRVTYEQALNSQEDLMPAKLAFGQLAVPEVAMPGKTKLV
jgi:predicted dehydrogenase